MIKSRMRYDIVRLKIKPDNIKDFKIIDDRVKHPEFIKDRDFLENEMVEFQEGRNTNPYYPDRYDLTVFTYNQFEPEWLIVDGSHRLEGLKRLFKKKKLKEFDAILIPSNVLGASTLEARALFSRALDTLLTKEGLPHWVKKYDWKAKESRKMSELLLLKTDFPSEAEFNAWSNKNRIDTGDADAETMPIDEYQKSRESQHEK